MDAPEAPGTQRPGGRTARNREAVLEAAMALLAESGYADLCVQDIANRSGVAPSTIYRRWGGVEGVILDLATELVTSAVPVPPDTGALETDLVALGQIMLEVLRSPDLGRISASLVAASVHTPAARDTMAAIIDSRAEGTKVIAERAIERGEIPADTDPLEVIHTLAAPIYHRWFVSGGPLGPQEIARFARITAHVARDGLLGSQAGSGTLAD